MTTMPPDQGLGENIRLATELRRLVVLCGERQYDRFITVNGSGGQVPVSLEGMLWGSLKSLAALWTYDPATATPRLFRLDPNARLTGGMADIGRDNHAAIEVADLMERFTSTRVEGEGSNRLALLIDANLLWEDAANPRDNEHRLLQTLEHFARSPSLPDHRVILRTQNAARLPAALLTSPWVRDLVLPATNRDERTSYARLRLGRIAEGMGQPVETLASHIASLTDGWLLEEVDALIRTCEQQGIVTPGDLESTARTFRMGIVRSPWGGSEVFKAVADAEVVLARRVRGQPAALGAVCRSLRKSCTGISGAHQGAASRGPRATLFFAGPTGTGKTEMAKAIAELLFGDENAMIRFDCAEFRQDHSVARLIGAPPGYVGHESGGELTDRIRARPHSVVLFDEIEKAHGRMLDLFLSILDDGRLTDSSGSTASFSECVLIFTSNLGIYEDVTDSLGHPVRRPRFDMHAGYDQIAGAVRAAIREEFITALGRPELLGRLGGERALIVFDFLRDLEGVARKFVDNVCATMARLHGVELRVCDSVIQDIVADARGRPEALVLGARGLAQSLDGCFLDAWDDFLFGKGLQGMRVDARLGSDGQVAFSEGTDTSA